MRTPPKHEPSPAAIFEAKGGRLFTTGTRWVARLNGRQAVDVSKDVAARKLLIELDI